MRHVLLYQDEDGYWIAEEPSLPGCVSDGETIDEALHNIDDATDGYIASLGSVDVSFRPHPKSLSLRARDFRSCFSPLRPEGEGAGG
jgi:predicted RNase H-like HicB family nuclease